MIASRDSPVNGLRFEEPPPPNRRRLAIIITVIAIVVDALTALWLLLS